MLRAMLLLGLSATGWFASSPAEACSYAVPRNPGEAVAHAYERLGRANQDLYWAEADTVFVGEVVGLRADYPRLEVRVLPRASFKGDAGTGVITYDLNGIEIQCDRAAFPDFGKVGLFYGSRVDGRFAIRGMLGPNDIRDEALKARVIRRLEPGELTTLAMETPSPDRWPLVLAGLTGCCGFIGGMVVSRMRRKRTVA